MVYCFAPDCKHSTDTHSCKFWRPPKNAVQFKKWETLLRRADRKLSYSSKVCECHFKDGLKTNCPTIFKHNEEKTYNIIVSPKKIPTRRSHHKIVRSSAPGPALPGISGLRLNDGNDQELPSRATDDQELPSRATEVDPDERRADTPQNRIEQKDERVKDLNKLLVKKKEVCYEFLVNTRRSFTHYTGLTVEKFDAFFLLFEDIPINYYYEWNVDVLSRKNQLLVFLIKLRQNLTYEDLAYRFGVSIATISNVFVTWLHLVHKIFYQGVFLKLGIPSREKNQQCLPASFKDFPNCRIIIDCTEIKIEIPGDMNMQKHTYSSYKSGNTLKALIGVAPNGCPTFVSQLFPGSKSDKEMVLESKLLEHMVPGDCILADKGFLISEILPPGVLLNMPPFLCTPQFSVEQCVSGEKVSSARVHVERAIKRIREYKILKLIPGTFMEYGSMILQVCVAMQEFNSPLIKEVAKKFK